MKGIHNRWDDLIEQIKSDQLRREMRSDEEGSLEIFTPKTADSEQSTTGLNGRFVQSQLLISCLSQMNINRSDMDEFVSYFEERYKENPHYLRQIEQFKREYSSEDSVKWYTKDSFVYGVLNEALRKQDIDSLFPFHFFIRNMEKQIQKHRCSEPIDLYRGQRITKGELQILRNSVNSLISFNSFLSTSRNIDIAYMYAGCGATNNDPDVEHVIFEINTSDPNQLGKKPFVSVSKMSQFSSEKEILIMLGAVFRMRYIFLDHTQQIWHIKLDLCSDQDYDVRNVVHSMGKQYKSMSNGLLRFAYVLIDMSHFEDAEKYLHRVLGELPPSHQDIPNCYQALGKIYCEQGKYQFAHDNLRKAIEFLQKFEGSNCYLGYIYNNIGEVYQNEGNWPDALKSYGKALNLFRKLRVTNDETIAWCYNNIGIIYQKQKNYKKAYFHFERALQIKRKVLPRGHPCLGNTYINIGNVCYQREDYIGALKNYMSSSYIFEESLKPRHPSMARVLRNIGLTYEMLNRFDEAKIKYEQLFAIRKSILSPNHPDLNEIKEDMKRLLNKIYQSFITG